MQAIDWNHAPALPFEAVIKDGDKTRPVRVIGHHGNQAAIVDRECLRTYHRESLYLPDPPQPAKSAKAAPSNCSAAGFQEEL